MLEDDSLARFITIDAFHRQFYCSSSNCSLNAEEQAAAVSLIASIQFHDSFMPMSSVAV
jgi:hypothetical protein